MGWTVEWMQQQQQQQLLLLGERCFAVCWFGRLYSVVTARGAFRAVFGGGDVTWFWSTLRFVTITAVMYMWFVDGWQFVRCRLIVVHLLPEIQYMVGRVFGLIASGTQLHNRHVAGHYQSGVLSCTTLQRRRTDDTVEVN